MKIKLVACLAPGHFPKISGYLTLPSRSCGPTPKPPVQGPAPPLSSRKSCRVFADLHRCGLSPAVPEAHRTFLGCILSQPPAPGSLLVKPKSPCKHAKAAMPREERKISPLPHMKAFFFFLEF